MAGYLSSLCSLASLCEDEVGIVGAYTLMT